VIYVITLSKRTRYHCFWRSLRGEFACHSLAKRTVDTEDARFLPCCDSHTIDAIKIFENEPPAKAKGA